MCKVALFPLIRVRAAREALVSFTLVLEHWIIPLQSSNPKILISHSLEITSPSSEEAEDMISFTKSLLSTGPSEISSKAI
jgi:hypothetical protein